MNYMPDIQEEVRKWILKAIEKAGGEGKLAQMIGVKTETVRSWVSLSRPSLNHVEKIVRYLREDK